LQPVGFTFRNYIERKQLLSISDDFFCSLIAGDNVPEDNISIPNEALAKAIKDFWAEGERNVMGKTAEAMGIKGVILAWEVVEMKLLGVQRAGMLKFENLETGVSMDVPHPMGEGEKIDRLLEVEKGQNMVMGIHFTMPTEWTIPSITIRKRYGRIEDEFRSNNSFSLS
jgi:hypothetical protein